MSCLTCSVPKTNLKIKPVNCLKSFPFAPQRRGKSLHFLLLVLFLDDCCFCVTYFVLPFPQFGGVPWTITLHKKKVSFFLLVLLSESKCSKLKISSKSKRKKKKIHSQQGFGSESVKLLYR